MTDWNNPVCPTCNKIIYKGETIITSDSHVHYHSLCYPNNLPTETTADQTLTQQQTEQEPRLTNTQILNAVDQAVKEEFKHVKGGVVNDVLHELAEIQQQKETTTQQEQEENTKETESYSVEVENITKEELTDKLSDIDITVNANNFLLRNMLKDEDQQQQEINKAVKKHLKEKERQEAKETLILYIFCLVFWLVLLVAFKLGWFEKLKGLLNNE